MLQLFYLVDQPGQHDGLSFPDPYGRGQFLKVDNRIGYGLGASAGGWKFHLYLLFDPGDRGYDEQRDDAIPRNLGCQSQLQPENCPLYGASKGYRVGFEVFIHTFDISERKLKTDREHGGLPVENSQVWIGQHGHFSLGSQKIDHRTEARGIRQGDRASAIKKQVKAVR